MFRHAFKNLLSTLLMISVASCAAFPHELVLEPRQGGCLSALPRPNPVNTIGRISFQRYIDEPSSTGDEAVASWSPNNLVDVHMTIPINVAATQNINISVTNRGSSANAIILTNYQDTRVSTQPRAQIRVTVPARTRRNGAVMAGTTSECVYLPRLDGTWYFQVEHE